MLKTTTPQPDTRTDPWPQPRQQRLLFPQSQILSNTDGLKPSTAASIKPPHEQNHEDSSTTSDSLLISSPYSTPPHLLDLNTLAQPNQFLAKALTTLNPIRDDYAVAPYAESFNWTFVFERLRELARLDGYVWKAQDFYVVVFRSRACVDVEVQRLQELDARSHQEATESGGLLKYWFGKVNEKRENMATCIWRNREDARRGGMGPWHRKACDAARELYEWIDFRTLKLEVDDGVRGWRFWGWVEDDE